MKVGYLTSTGLYALRDFTASSMCIPSSPNPFVLKNSITCQDGDKVTRGAGEAGVARGGVVVSGGAYRTLDVRELLLFANHR